MSGESGVPGGDPRSAAEDGWDWDALLAFIDERRVIPIVGPDLLRIEVDGVPTTFDHYVAKQLAGRMSVPAERLPAEFIETILSGWWTTCSPGSSISPAPRAPGCMRR